MLDCSPQSLDAHTEHSRRWAVRLEATASTAATSTATVASEATTSTAAERHVVWLFGALLVFGLRFGGLSRMCTTELFVRERFALRDRR